jgi:Fur family ferric uptake transcriptional regulator
MIKLGIVWPTVQGGTTVHYMLMPGDHHHHIVCTRCGRLIEFEDCGLGALIRLLESRFDMRIDGHLLELYGICAECRAS